MKKLNSKSRLVCLTVLFASSSMQTIFGVSQAHPTVGTSFQDFGAKRLSAWKVARHDQAQLSKELARMKQEATTFVEAFRQYLLIITTIVSIRTSLKAYCPLYVVMHRA